MRSLSVLDCCEHLLWPRTVVLLAHKQVRRHMVRILVIDAKCCRPAKVGFNARLADTIHDTTNRSLHTRCSRMEPLGRNRCRTSLGRTSPYLKNRDLNYTTTPTPTTDTRGKPRLDSTARIFGKTTACRPHHNRPSAQLPNPPLHPPSHKHPGAHAAVTTCLTTARYTARACGTQDLIRNTTLHHHQSCSSAQLPRRPIQLRSDRHPGANAAVNHMRILQATNILALVQPYQRA